MERAPALRLIPSPLTDSVINRIGIIRRFKQYKLLDYVGHWLSDGIKE